MKKTKRPMGEDLFRATVQADFMLQPNSKCLEADRNLAAQFLRLFKAVSELSDDGFYLCEVSEKSEATIEEMLSAKVMRKKYRRRMRK